MNSLEFIRREIMFTQQEENIIKSQIESTPNDRELQIKLKVIQECLSHLQQIKSVLVAWEIIKHSISKEHLEDYQIRTMYGENPFMNINGKEQLIIKKALEVDNSIQWVKHTLKDFKGGECEK